MYVDVNGTTRYTELVDLAKWSVYAVQINALTVRNGKWSTEIQHQTSEDGKNGHILWVLQIKSFRI